jgi:hypothetical protein
MDKQQKMKILFGLVVVSYRNLRNNKREFFILIKETGWEKRRETKQNKKNTS